MRYLVIVLFGLLNACGGSDNPADDTTQLMVVAHQTPQPILIQSVMLDQNHLCQSDVETQLMYKVTAYSLQITGVISQSVGKYSLSSP